MLPEVTAVDPVVATRLCAGLPPSRASVLDSRTVGGLRARIAGRTETEGAMSDDLETMGTAEALGEWRVAERELATATAGRRAAEQAAAAAKLAESAAAATAAAARHALEAASAAEESARATADAARATLDAANQDLSDKSAAEDVAGRAETRAQTDYQQAEQRARDRTR